ncbi:MAG: response regulator transcription factor [Bacilli bacterium]|nr:response regulator transcription factor [Bacilli bacterium]
MIKFVVCDDEDFFRKKVTDVINKIFMKNNIEYQISSFSGYNKSLEKIINTNMNAKIYILDIEMKNSISGIDIARKIRKNDWNSIIILVTSHTELGYEALKAQIMLLDFISKYDNCDKNLEEVLRKAIEQFNEKKSISFKSSGMSYRIFTKDIIYILKDSVDRKCIIRTTYSEIPINKTLSEIHDLLDERFYLTHRGCLVNTSEISYVDWKNSIIHFNNNTTIDLIARDKKRGLKEYVGIK